MVPIHAVTSKFDSLFSIFNPVADIELSGFFSSRASVVPTPNFHLLFSFSPGFFCVALASFLAVLLFSESTSSHPLFFSSCFSLRDFPLSKDQGFPDIKYGVYHSILYLFGKCKFHSKWSGIVFSCIFLYYSLCFLELLNTKPVFSPSKMEFLRCKIHFKML